MSNDFETAIEQVMREDASYNAAIEQVMREDALRPKPDNAAVDDQDGDDGPTKGRVTNIRFLEPQSTNAPEDGASEHETSGAPLFSTKLQIQTAEAPHGIIVAGSTTVSDRDMLFRTQVAVFGGTWKADDYDQRVLSDAAIMVIEPKKPAAAIFTRAGLTPPQIEKVIKHFGEEAAEILAEHPERIEEIKSIRPATAEKFLKAAQDNHDIPLDILAILTETGIAGHKALELVRRRFLRHETVEGIAHKVFGLVYNQGCLRFRDANLIAQHPRITAIKSYHENDAERIIAFLVDVMTHSIEFGFEEYVYEGHCGYFIDETLLKFPKAMPPSLKEIFFRKWCVGLEPPSIEVGSRIGNAAFGCGTILSVTKTMVGGRHEDVAYTRFDDGKEKRLRTSNLAGPAFIEIKAAWEAARNFPIWNKVFIEHEIEGKEVVYLRDEYETECEIVHHLHRIFKGKKTPFGKTTHSLCKINFDNDQNQLLGLVYEHPIVLGNGGPGAGKTTLVKEVTLRAGAAGLLFKAWHSLERRHREFGNMQASRRIQFIWSPRRKGAGGLI